MRVILIHRVTVLGLVIAVWLPWTSGWSSQTQTTPVQLQMTLSKQQYLEREEIPLVVTITCVDLPTDGLRTQAIVAAVDLELIDQATNQVVKPQMEKMVPIGLGIGFHIRIRRNAQGQIQPPRQVHTGATIQAEMGILNGHYGRISAGRYQLRSVYKKEGIILYSQPLYLTVQPLPQREQEAFELYRQVMNAPLEVGPTFLQRFPNSIFTRRVQYEILLEATKAPDWSLGLRLGRQLAAQPRWQCEQEAVTMLLAECLWHTGNRTEAESLLLSVDRGEASGVLKQLREGNE